MRMLSTEEISDFVGQRRFSQQSFCFFASRNLNSLILAQCGKCLDRFPNDEQPLRELLLSSEQGREFLSRRFVCLPVVRRLRHACYYKQT